jgi:hypothetical protein
MHRPPRSPTVFAWAGPDLLGRAHRQRVVDALYQCVQLKIHKYAAKPTGMHEFYLLVHYDKAFVYNSPVQGIGFGYREGVKAVSARIGNRVGHFDRIFVFVPVIDRPLFRLFP